MKIYPTQEFKDGVARMGDTSHPHRGIATFTYLLRGGVEHFDSAENHGIVREGGIQWMKSGNGIIHKEVIVVDDDRPEASLNGLQFWINLPAKNKAEPPEYMSIQNEDVPEIELPENRGRLGVLIGAYENAVSKIPTYSDLFNFHVIINPNKSCSFDIKEGNEAALVVVKGQQR